MRGLRITLSACLLAGSLLAACEDETAPEAATTESEGEVVAENGTDDDPGATGAAEGEDQEDQEDQEDGVDPTAEELPIAEDFADEAEEAINADNYGAELDELAAEIEADLVAGG